MCNNWITVSVQVWIACQYMYIHVHIIIYTNKANYHLGKNFIPLPGAMWEQSQSMHGTGHMYHVLSLAETVTKRPDIPMENIPWTWEAHRSFLKMKLMESTNFHLRHASLRHHQPLLLHPLTGNPWRNRFHLDMEPYWCIIRSQIPWTITDGFRLWIRFNTRTVNANSPGIYHTTPWVMC